MSRSFLDPAATAGSPIGPERERLRAAVRTFNHYPDVAKLQPGDLILVRPAATSANVLAIEGAQARRHAPFDAQWIHAAAYIGDGGLVEIGAKGVAVNDLDKYVGRHRLHFRRPLDLAGQDADIETGYRIAIAALKMFKTTYGMGDIITLARQAIVQDGDYVLRPRSAAAICSDYYNDAVARVLGRGAVSAKLNPFSPADLSASTNMRDLAVGWTRLP